MARRSRAALLPWAGAVVQVGAISLWHSSALAVAMASAASLLVCMALLGLTEGRTWGSAHRR
jgi:hypothetical protein